MAHGASPERRVKAEGRIRCIGIGNVAGSALKAFGIRPNRFLTVVAKDVDEKLSGKRAFAAFKGCLHGFEAARKIGFGDTESIGHDGKNRPVGCFALGVDSCKASGSKTVNGKLVVKIFRDQNVKCDDKPRVGSRGCPGANVRPHVHRRHATHGLSALFAKQVSFLFKQKLEVIIQFRHRPDG